MEQKLPAFCCEYKLKRSQRRSINHQKQKRFIKLYKEENRLWKLRNNLGWYTLEKPYQKGFERSFELTYDTLKSPKAAFYEELLTYINTIQYCHHKDFLVKRKKQGKKVYIEKEQTFHGLFDQKFDKIPDKFKGFFEKQARMDGFGKLKYYIYRFSEPWRYTLRVRPKMITKVKIGDSLLDQQIKLLNNYITRNNYQPKICKAIGANYKWKNEWKPLPYKKHLPKQQIIKQIHEQY